MRSYVENAIPFLIQGLQHLPIVIEVELDLGVVVFLSILEDLSRAQTRNVVDHLETADVFLNENSATMEKEIHLEPSPINEASHQGLDENKLGPPPPEVAKSHMDEIHAHDGLEKDKALPAVIIEDSVILKPSLELVPLQAAMDSPFTKPSSTVDPIFGSPHRPSPTQDVPHGLMAEVRGKLCYQTPFAKQVLRASTSLVVAKGIGNAQLAAIIAHLTSHQETAHYALNDNALALLFL